MIIVVVFDVFVNASYWSMKKSVTGCQKGRFRDIL